MDLSCATVPNLRRFPGDLVLPVRDPGVDGFPREGSPAETACTYGAAGGEGLELGLVCGSAASDVAEGASGSSGAALSCCGASWS
eukprot:2236812-Pyramimonas_sp.AAC.1